MPRFNAITGEGVPPPTDGSYETVSVTQKAEPEPVDSGFDPFWAGDGVDEAPPSQVDSGMTASPPADPVSPEIAPTDPPNIVEGAAISILNALDRNFDKIKGATEWIDSHLGVGTFKKSLEMGQTWGTDIAPVIGPNPPAPKTETQ